jgi:hypothetical protein
VDRDKMVSPTQKRNGSMKKQRTKAINEEAEYYLK